MQSFITLPVFLLSIAFYISPVLNEVSVSVNGGIEFVLVDPLGRREGIDPITNQRYREINNSYGEFSVDSEDPDVDPPEPINEFMTHEPSDGLYRLTLYGTKVARYRLFITVFSQDKGQGIDTYGLIDSNQVRVLEFNYSSDSTMPFVVKKLVTATGLREDLSNCFKLGFLGGRPLYRELSQKVNRIDKRFEKKDSSGAHKELERLAKELKKVWEETERHEKRKRTPSRFVTTEAYQILNEDITILMSSFSPRKHHKGDDDKKDRRNNDQRGDRS
ncbi:MAG TPA: hypothetical protein VJN65_01690 [Bacteroidota bacterium]|nr:hypothetical protein [Bacteroidota bacterium]